MKRSIWLIAPPASGKTSMLLDVFAQLPEERWIFLSPLRALAEEFYLRTKDIIPTQMYFKNKNDSIVKKGLIICTPEQIDEKFLSLAQESILIVDEMHLWIHWGDSFRPQMWEAYFALTHACDLVFHMTATVNSELKEWIDQSRCQFENTIFLDYGNNRMKFSPQRLIYYPSFLKISAENSIKRKIQKNKTGCILVFCAYRKEVTKWSDWARDQKIRTLSCVGGEAVQFQKDLAECSENPELIISTTVLSHGVNLPEITAVYFTYQVKDKDFWIQMTTRGGRRGQDYEVLTFDGEFLNPARRCLGFFAMLREEFITLIQQMLNSEGPWSLKESLPPKYPIRNVT